MQLKEHEVHGPQSSPESTSSRYYWGDSESVALYISIYIFDPILWPLSCIFLGHVSKKLDLHYLVMIWIWLIRVCFSFKDFEIVYVSPCKPDPLLWFNPYPGAVILTILNLLSLKKLSQHFAVSGPVVLEI